MTKKISRDPIENLVEYMYKHGFSISNEPNLDGSLHRFSGRPEKPKDEDEWYVGFYSEGYVYCTFGSWRNGSEAYRYKSWDNDEVSPEIIKRIEDTKKRQSKQ